jgi:hypothetical protein
MKFEEFPNWTFKVLEVSASVYRVTGYDSAGRSVERQGLDPDVLLDEAKQDAIEILKRDGKK